MYGDLAAKVFVDSLPAKSRVLDVGAGRETGFKLMVEKAGHTYVPFDFTSGENWEGYLRRSHFRAYDGVWMSHVLEHLHDTHAALIKIHQVIKDGGIIGVTVPPLKHEIVGGHVSLWNSGLLLYRLVLAGFDCSKAAVKSYGYNCSVVVRRKPAKLPDLNHDRGDIEALSHFFPIPVSGDSFVGQIREANWGPV